jgi:hypothetical protein
MSQYALFEKLTISFDTGPLPPPFCHRYDIVITRETDGFSASLNLDYYDRDEIAEEEIFDEGFTLNDNFEWKGKLPEFWGREIKQKLAISNWHKMQPEDGGLSTFVIKYGGGGRSEMLYPAERRTWEVFAQEIIQAIFELGQKEAPLQIEYLKVETGSKKQTLTLIYRFSLRRIEVFSSKSGEKSMDWKEGQKLMQYIFYFDFLPEEAKEVPPSMPGNYINPGDGFWYSFDAPETANQDLSVRWEKLIEKLDSYL